MISFIIPARDEEKLILNTLRSIYSQDIPDEFEVIVVDNDSKDSTSALVKKNFSKVKVVFESVHGTNSARQRGFANSRGQVLIFLDADVCLPDGWVRRVLKKLYSSDKIVAVSAPYKFYDFPWYWEFLNEIWMFFAVNLYSLVILNWWKLGAQMVGGCSVIKRRALEKVGGFDTSFKFYLDDTYTATQLKKIGKVVFSPKFWVWSSARRYKKVGVIKMTFGYLYEFFYLMIKKQPLDKGEVEEVR